jgi:hypothetical protein
MKDVEIRLEHRPGALADVGEAFGAGGVSIEGGGVFVVGGVGIAHFLVADGEAARRALASRGVAVHAVRDVVVQRLDQATPGQVGKLARRMAEASVNIEVMYSDHAQQLVLVVDDAEAARAVAACWMRERRP